MKKYLENFYNWHIQEYRQYHETNEMLLKYISFYENENIKPKKTIVCEFCKKSFIQKVRFDYQKYCSVTCREQSYYKKRKEKNEKNNIND
jgi:hypothetical protein